MITLLTVAVLIVASVYDTRHRRIPNKLILILATIGAANIVIAKEHFPDFLIGFIFPSVVLIAARIIGVAIGAGDIKLLSCLGLICGVAQNTAVFIMSCIFALIYVFVCSLIVSKQHSPSVAFAPFICCSFIIIEIIQLLFL